MKKLNGQIDFFFHEFGKEIIIKGNRTKVIISDATTKPSYYDDKYIRTDMPFDTGTILEYQNEKWLVISQIVADKNTYKAKIRKANWQISFYIQSVLYHFYCVVDNLDVSLEEGKIINTAAGEMKLIMPATDFTNNLSIDQRFLKFGSAWKITGIDKSKMGLNMIYAKKDLFTDKDDRDNEIADRWSYETKHIYTIAITDNNPVSFEVGEVRKLNYAVYDNGTIMDTPPEVIFTIGNEAVATIDGTGSITALSQGETTVCCKLKEIPTIKTESTLKVVQQVLKEYSITLTYTNANLTIGGGARSFTGKVFYGNTQVTDKTVKWSVRNTDGTATNMVTLTDKGNNVCSLKAVDNESYIGKKIILKVELSDNNKVINEVTISLVAF